ncbi:MAG: dihydroorotate dehydrogenase electron transfer subunit [Paramuribaculum sp.]|nr:dihydroorotate dehydrogenase electron transfer subunit [Paramuribaculum sp.]
MKRIIVFRIVSNTALGSNYTLMKLTPEDNAELPDTCPGQFVQIYVPDSKSTYLRRPISINFVDKKSNQLWLLIRNAGDGTAALMRMKAEERLNIIMPLGNGFTLPSDGERKLLLVGGGVGVAPLYALGHKLVDGGYRPVFLLGARSESDLLMLDEFKALGDVMICTDDGSVGHHGVVTTHEVMNGTFDRIYCCGPMPMMKAVANMVRNSGAECEVSLENTMACGVGACLCCVEPTVKGNVCVCTEGPVFNINQLTW